MQRVFFILWIIASLCVIAQPVNQNILLMVDPSTVTNFSQEINTRDASFIIEPLLNSTSREVPNNWFIARPTTRTNVNTWDLAYQLLESHPEIIYAEPDAAEIFCPEEENARGGSGGDECKETEYTDDWDHPKTRVFQWHLEDSWSQLKSARQSDKDRKIRIAHFDTGYDPGHITTPKYICTNLQKNFVEGENPDSAIDPGIDGIMNQPGHGTATVALLAGNRIQRTQDNFNDYMGAAPYCEIVPVRISSTVILFQSSSFVKALYYIMSPEVHCDVLSMSMGGVASKFWAEAVNAAYEKGIVLVTAAGNNIGKKPTTEVVYPACFNRVIAVCGVTYNNKPYFKYGFFTLKMQGNYGPPEVMGSAIASYTPNVPWASRGCVDKIDYDGAGTSAATPQVAGAAALWLQKYQDYVYDHPWQRVNAVRRALFSSAEKGYADSEKYYGNGVLKAKRALDIPPFKDSQPVPKDDASFAAFKLLFGFRSDASNAKQDMMEVEMLRLRHNNSTLQEVFQIIEKNKIITTEQRQKIKQTVLSMPECSQTLAQEFENFIK